MRKTPLFEEGLEVEEAARKLFPGGVEVPFEHDDFDGMVARTKALLSSGCEVIYQAAFKKRGIFIVVDMLVKNGDCWYMYEVKSAVQLQMHHLHDAALQWFVLSKSVDVGRAFLLHIDSSYERSGALDVHALFREVDVTVFAQKEQKKIAARIRGFKSVLKGALPETDIGKYCLEPYECAFRSHCWQHIPAGESVFDLSYANGRQWQLYADGIVRIEDIPDDVRFGKNASLQIAHHRSQKIKLEKSEIVQFLSSFKYPINFFDFETFRNAVPRFDGQRPYAQIPFQYSLHIVYEDGSMEHKSFLGDEQNDPRKPLAVQMLRDITPEGTIVAYNQAFEMTQIKNLAAFYPQMQQRLLELLPRFKDLAHPFQYKHYYHPKFHGKYSIKVVLPTLFPDDPELNYAKLGRVQNGSDAMHIFANLHRIDDGEKRAQIRNDLLAYCRLDTLAMVRIWQKLHEIVHRECADGVST